MYARSMKIIRFVLLILIALNLAFIVAQSLLPPEESSKESSAVGDIIEQIIPPDTLLLPAGNILPYQKIYC